MTEALLKGHKGGGGGKGKGSSASAAEADNTLRSRARVRIVELLGEGEISGLVSGAKSIYFDDTPLQNADDSFNIQGITHDQRVGLPDQAYLTGAAFVATPFNVETQVRQSIGPVTRTINEENADAVRVVMRIPSLFQNSNGSLQTASVSYTIEVRPDGGAWSTAVTQNIVNQKCTAPYQKAHRIVLPQGGNPWQIRVTRVTADSASTDLQNETWWESYTVLTEGKYTYPHSALIYMEVDAEQAGSNIPARTYRVRGLKTLVPTNYDPVTRIYSGSWDGTFKTAWHSNPAWVLYDLIVNDRYGIGEFVDASRIDKWTLYQIGQYCDEMVDSGFEDDESDPIQEPRFSFNGVIDTPQEAFRLLQQIAAVFRGMTYWSLGQVFSVADMPTDPTQLVSPANVINGEFIYSGTSMKARHSAALVRYNDPSDQYRPAYELVVDDDQLEAFGWRQIDVQMVGCASRGEAVRFGRWILDSEKNETETVEYRASWDHMGVRPGHIVSIADPRKAQIRAGGRLLTVASASSMVLDGPFEPGDGITYNLMAVLPDQTVEYREITSFTDLELEGAARTRVVVSPAFSAAPEKGAMFIVTGADVAPRNYRVLDVNETEPNIFKVTALFHDPSKYARVEQNLILDPVQYTRPTNTILPPTALNGVEQRFVLNGQGRSRVTLSWTPAADFLAKSYEVSVQTPNDGYYIVGQTTGLSMDIENIVTGDYIFYVRAISFSGRVSTPASLEFSAEGWAGATTPQVVNLRVNGSTGSTFSGRDLVVTYDNFFPDMSEDTDNSAYSPFYRDNEIVVKDTTSGDVLRTVYTMGQTFTYTYEMNVLDNQAYARSASRAVTFEVKLRDTIGRSSNAATKAVTNPVPAKITPTVNPGAESVFVTWPIPSDPDYAGAQVWISETSGFDPLATTPSYDGNANAVTIPSEGGEEAYVRVALYDGFGKTGLNISDEIAVTPLVAGGDKIPPGIPSDLAAPLAGFGTVFLTWTPPADEDLSHIEVWVNTTNNISTATHAGDFVGSDGVVTRLTPGVNYYIWIRAVDISGNKSNFTSPITKTTSLLGSTQISDNAVLTQHLAAGSVVADKIAAGTITADKMNVSTLSALTANIGTVTAGIIKSVNNKFIIDLNTGSISVYL